MQHKDISQEARIAALLMLPFDSDGPEPCHLWDNTYEIQGEEWKILTEEEADQACKDQIKESLWAFNPEFLTRFIDADLDAGMIRDIQGDRCEDANDTIVALVGSNLDRLVEEAILSDTRGHFLSSYDGEEIGSECGTFFLYRVN